MSKIKEKIEYSIDLMKRAEKTALAMNEEGFRLAFSGGKDSIVMYHLAKMANVKFKPYLQLTTIDHPELLRYIRKEYPDTIMERPEMNFYKLIIKKRMLPLRQARYCCRYLKRKSRRRNMHNDRNTKRRKHSKSKT